MLEFTPQPHMDPVALIRCAAVLLRAWEAKYGEHQPCWLPPAGCVRWLEDADRYLAMVTLPAPTIGVAAGEGGTDGR